MSKIKKDEKVITDKWLQGYSKEEYNQYLKAYFDNPSNQKISSDLKKLEKSDDQKLMEMRAKYFLEKDKIGGYDYYILKKSKIRGTLLERDILIRNISLIQVKQDKQNNNKEKELGKIQSLTLEKDNTFKGEHSTKLVLKADVIKDNQKARSVYILCKDREVYEKIMAHWRLNRDIAKNSFAFIKKIATNFKFLQAQGFRAKLTDYVEAQKRENEEKEREREGQERQFLDNIFKDYDKKNITELIDKWKKEANKLKNSEADSKQRDLLEKQRKEKEKRLQMLRQNKEINNIDKKALSECFDHALYYAKQRQQEEEDANRVEKVKRSRNEKKLHMEFSQICLSQTLKMMRPIVDIYYILNKNITKYDLYKEVGKEYVVAEPGQQAAPEQLRRKINDKEMSLKDGQDELFQIVFTGKMHTKMSDNSYLWNLVLHEGFQTTSQQLRDETIRFGDLASCEKDTIRISLYDEMNQKKKYITYITVSDLITSQTNTKQIWLNLTLDGLKNITTKILLKVNIFKSPTIQTQPHSSFEDYLEKFTNLQYPMIDPIYLIPLQKLTLIKSSIIYFLERLNDEGLGSTNSIKILQFLVDVIPNEQSAPIEFPQDFSDRLVYQDFRKIFYEAISMHLTSSYAKNVLIQEDHQEELLEKIGEPDSKKIHKIVKEIQNFKHKITYEDLKKLFIHGVPSRYRCLYWSNFLQINNVVKDDINKNPDGFVSTSNDLVKRFEFYEKQDHMTCVKSFVDSLEVDVMGKSHVAMLENIINAFTNYLKFHRIADLTYEDRLRFNMFRFIQRVYISLYPTFMKTEDNLHSSFFEKKEKDQNKISSMSMKKIDQNDFTDDEQQEKDRKIRAEIFWFSVAFYNLYFKHLVAMEDEKGMESMKKRIATGIVAYETLLNTHSKQMIQQNQLYDIIKEQWFMQLASFFYSSFQSYNFTKILDIVVFEFGMNLMDGFENAIIACFVTLLDRVKLEGIINTSQLENAFIVEGLFLQQNFFVDLYKNMAMISKGFDPQLIERKMQTIEFNQFGELYLPQELNEKNMDIDKKLLETLQTSHANRTIDLVPAQPNGNLTVEYNSMSPQKQSRAVNVKSPYVNRKDFFEQDNEENQKELNPLKTYLVSHRGKAADIDKDIQNPKQQKEQQQQQQQQLQQKQQQQQEQQKQQQQQQPNEKLVSLPKSNLMGQNNDLSLNQESQIKDQK